MAKLAEGVSYVYANFIQFAFNYPQTLAPGMHQGDFNNLIRLVDKPDLLKHINKTYYDVLYEVKTAMDSAIDSILAMTEINDKEEDLLNKMQQLLDKSDTPEQLYAIVELAIPIIERINSIR